MKAIESSREMPEIQTSFDFLIMLVFMLFLCISESLSK